MIPTLSESAPFITVSVGNEIRVRDGHKPEMRDVQRASEKKTSVLNADFIERKKVERPFNEEQIQATVARLQEALKPIESRVELYVDNDINQVIFRVVDKETGDLIRQIPLESVVELDRFLSGHSGLLVEEDI
ncbi:MAG: flagellar protein FlaG [Nitrospirota bacterium]|nr:flagellar protein FlaG [Nitrospirota bacterium]MDH4359850.1 flagellar protein FlaG [Nitrospirota bacterium]MDH5296650.1 flagellar protein FlaG [Nitrospirota bacterium]MDH5576081.1 flagellar protein FlaG [Nitrospirota bacterium]